MIKLSYIVPIYNVEQYLRKCVDSLINQNYPSDKYEIILVDDGSTDGSGDLADSLANNSPQSPTIALSPKIQVIHRENGGLSAARNSGIDVAQGEYICFVDSDDYWEENVLGGLMAQIERDQLDVLRFKWRNVRLVEARDEGRETRDERREDENEMRYEVFSPYKSDPYRNDDYSSEVTTGVDFLNHRLGTACYAWAFILRTEIVKGDKAIRRLAKGERFTEGVFFEDTDWTPRMLLHAQRIASTDTIVYNYLIREGSITNAINLQKQRKVLEDKIRLVRVLQEYNVKGRSWGVEDRWYRRMIAATMVSISGMLANEFWKDRRTYLRQLKSFNIYPLSTENSTSSAKRKIRLLNVCPNGAIWLLHLRNKL